MNQVRILRRSSVTAMTSLSRPTIYRLMQQGQFPQALRLSANTVGWDVRDVVEWIENRKVASTKRGAR